MELFRLFGTIAVDNSGANSAIDETTDHAEQSQSKISSAFGKIGNAALKVGKVMATGLAVGTVAITALGKSALGSYADFEQLVGGVETLFKESAAIVQEYADNAYKSAGMSANEYMETVTSFSASLLQSLDGDTAEAANKANQAIVDMSDNANKMGSSMESIQNAYQGFAKQNYTMLDNLKLGYGGTKEEMQRLLKDAQAISKIEYDISSYADVVDAIHVIQEEMGIAGTTAKEASSTISGSLSSMKSAWKNLLTGLGNEDADLSGLIDNFVDSAGTAMDNILPRVEVILGGISDTIGKIVPKIAKRLPQLLKSTLPSLIQGAVGLVNGLVSALPDILGILIPQIPFIVEQIGLALVEVFPQLLEVCRELLGQLWDYISTEVPFLGDIFTQAFALISEAWVSIQPVFDAFSVALTTIKEGLQPIIDKVTEYVTSGQAGVDATNLFKEAIELLAGAAQIVADAILAISEWCTTHQGTLEVIAIVIGSVAAAIVLVNTAIGIWNTVGVIATTVTTGLSTAIAFLTSPITLVAAAIAALIAIGVLLYKNWDEIKAKCSELGQAVQEKFTSIKNTISTIWSNIKTDLANKLNSIKTSVSNAFNNIKATIQTKLQAAKDKVFSVFRDIKDGIKSRIESARDTVKGAIDKIKGFFNFQWSLPHLKMPHPYISGSFSLNPPSVPSFGISWYKKAMNDPIIMNSPTAFGINKLGQIMAGGEAGSEVVSGTDTLMNMISEAVAAKNARLEGILANILAFLMEYMPQMAHMQLVTDTGALIGELAPGMDEALGELARREERGI